MEIQRDIYQKIVDWKNETGGTKALLVEGARRVGKSTVVEEIGRREYKSYIVVDFNNAGKRVKDAFEDLNQPDVFFQTLMLEYNTKLFRRESLIIFDEVQKFPRAREAVKYLVADGRYDYIETGSLISIKENVERITIPSEEKKIKMYPLNFEEFLGYMGEELLMEYIAECWVKKTQPDQKMHAKAMRLFKEYVLVGGMPQAVLAFASNERDFASADVEKRDILELYRDDIRKSAKKYKSKVSAIFENIPGYLSTHEKKIVLSEIDENGKFDRYDEPLFWLGDSMICNLCYKCNDPNVGLALSQNDSAVKCYMGDTGLLVSHAFSENEISDQNLYQQIMKGKLALNEGMIYENAIAQMLASKGKKLFFYTRYSRERHRNDIEIDFLLSNESRTNYKVHPVEVKSGKNYTTTSLGKFKELFGKRVGDRIIIHPKALSISDGIVRIPPYMIWCAIR
ncbi:MAG: ATP-binding protein [Lachnospiraceae bacterium]|nr:ATP-binding protein [Lachnospiraceae bacterium]